MATPASAPPSYPSALHAEGALDCSVLVAGDVSHAPTAFQLKAMPYHVGLLTERGSEPNTLDPTADVWTLEFRSSRRTRRNH